MTKESVTKEQTSSWKYEIETKQKYIVEQRRIV